MLSSGILICCTGPFWSGSLCLFGFCLPSLRCLISALTQAGGGDLLLRFASSVQSCCGEGRALQTDIAVCGEHSPCSGHTGFAPLTGVCAFPVCTAQAPGCSIWSWPCVACGSSSPQKRGFGCACVLCLPWPARGLALSLRGRLAFSLHGPSARRRSGLRESSDRTRGLFAGWEGVASLGLSLPLSPAPAPYLQRGWAGSSLEFLSPFVLRTAGGVFRPVNFSLLSHSLKKLPPTALGAFGPVPTLRNAVRSSPFRPRLLVAGAGVWGTFLLGVAFRHAICGPYIIFLPVRLPSEIWKLPADPPVRGFPGDWKLPVLRLPSRDGSLSIALLSPFLSLIFCPTSLQRQWAAFLGARCPLLVIRSCFVNFVHRSIVLSIL